MLIDCAHYRDGSRQNEEPLDVEEAAVRWRQEEGFVWLGLHDPDPDEMREIADRFDLPELAVEDAMKAHQRPKLEDYGERWFLVLHTARYLDEDEEVEFGEVHVFTGPGYVIVLRHGAASELHSARERLEQHPELLRGGTLAAVWAVMDKVVDDYLPVMAGLDNDVDEVEEAVFEGAGDQTRRIYFLRREISAFYKAVHPLVAVLEDLERLTGGKVEPELRSHLRDVADHVRRVDDDVVHHRDLLSNILQANLGVLAVQQNDVVRKISGWAAIIAVPTLIASVYGMNFEHMPELKWQFGYPLALTAMLGLGAGLYRFLRRAGWL